MSNNRLPGGLDQGGGGIGGGRPNFPGGGGLTGSGGIGGGRPKITGGGFPGGEGIGGGIGRRVPNFTGDGFPGSEGIGGGRPGLGLTGVPMPNMNQIGGLRQSGGIGSTGGFPMSNLDRLVGLNQGGGTGQPVGFPMPNMDRIGGLRWRGPIIPPGGFAEPKLDRRTEEFRKKFAQSHVEKLESLNIPRPQNSSYTTSKDKDMAARQTRFDTLSSEEQRKQEEWAQEKLVVVACVAGYGWYRVDRGYRCGGGSHFVTDELLAEGRGGFYYIGLEALAGPYYGRMHYGKSDGYVGYR